jgi:hypothetical protein
MNDTPPAATSTTAGWTASWENRHERLYDLWEATDDL